MGCCSPYEGAASRQFNRKKVAKEVRRYREKGPGRTARLLSDGIARAGALGGTVLDVGAGIGGLTFALLEGGASSAVAVDASASYVEAAREEASRRGHSEVVRFVEADFVHAAPGLASASVVTLDRVVCCYPSCEPLLVAALGRADRCLALSYPRGAWYVRLGMWLENAQRRVGGNPFRAFVHPPAAIRGVIERAGFALASRQETWTWSADVYVRTPRPREPAV